MSLYPGQFVVCVSVQPCIVGVTGYGDEIYPEKGRVYTIRETFEEQEPCPKILCEFARGS